MISLASFVDQPCAVYCPLGTGKSLRRKKVGSRLGVGRLGSIALVSSGSLIMILLVGCNYRTLPRAMLGRSERPRRLGGAREVRRGFAEVRRGLGVGEGGSGSGGGSQRAGARWRCFVPVVAKCSFVSVASRGI